MTDDRCGAHFARHPTKPHLIAVCALPKGHDGEHDNLLPKPPYSVLHSRLDEQPPSDENVTTP